MNHIISCAQYDYFEIACMHHYEIQLILNDTRIIQGTALNVKIVKDNESRKEILELLLETKTIIAIELMTIHKMRAVTINSHFKEITLINN